MTVLVTGAAGFIGSNLVDALLARGDEVIGLDNFDPYYDPAIKRRNLATAVKSPRFRLIEGDILDPSCLGALFQDRRPDGVVHLAACVSNRRSLLAGDSERYFLVNAQGTDRLVNAAAEIPLRSFVYVSTANIYDSSTPATFRENVTPDRPRTPYSKSKKAAEILVLRAAAATGLPATVLRMFTVFGPRQRPDMAQHRFCTALLRGEPLTMIGAGSDRRDYLYVQDACTAIIAALDRVPFAEIINVGSGSGITLQSLLALLSLLTEKPLLLKHQKADANDTAFLLADISKAERLLGWKPLVNLETGLKIFIDWLKETENPLKKEKCSP